MAASADVPSGSFATLARADGFRVQLTVSGFIADQITDTSGPSAQAKLDSLGDSEGFASALYPGDTIATAPGLVTGKVPGAPPSPAYPLAVKSQSSSNPDASSAQGPITLTAHSGDQASTGHASASGADQGGNALGKTVADTSVKVDNSGALISDASSDLESLSINGALRIGAVTASAHSQTTPDGKATTSSSFRTEGVTVAGTTVGLSDQGLTLPGSNQPLPDASSVAQALKSTGIEVTPLKPVTQPGSVSSGGVAITATEPGPTGPDTVTYTLGVVHAESSGQASPSSSAAGTDTGSASSAAPAGGAESPAGGAGAVPAGDQGGGALAAIPGGAGSPATASLPGSSPSAATRAPSSTSSNAAALGGLAVSTTSSLSIYLVLVVGAAVALSATFLFRVFAVRLAWIP
jgi:hypothetical protein